jgi:DNA-binding sugar fermentation-stimulating protein
LIEAFCQNLQFYEPALGFSPTTVRKNFSIGNGDIDILLEAQGRRAIIEVKAHQGLLWKFTQKQLPKYQSYFPDAEIYALTGTAAKSLEPQLLTLKKY